MKKMRNKSHRRDTHPPNLQGRDIGMYYRNRQIQRVAQGITAKPPIQLGPSVSLSDRKIAEIREYIDVPGSSRHMNLNHETLNQLIHDESIESDFKNYFLHIKHLNFEKQLAENVSKSCLNINNASSRIVLDPNDFIVDTFDSEKIEKMNKYRTTLPAYKHQKEIIDLIETNQVILVSGDTGCGKTTQVSQYILDHYIKFGKGSNCKIVCTQPRRISAITIAERVAEERLERIGSSVGYLIRLNSIIPRSKNGTILYCTAGILLKFMENDKSLANISHLILDEIHERDIVSDLSIGIIKKILPHRKDLKIILMSATLRAETFSKYFDNCPIISIEGRTFPVNEIYLEDVLEEIQFDKFASKQVNNVPIWVRKKNSKKFKADKDEFQSLLEPYAKSLEKNYSYRTIKSIMNPDSENLNIDLIEALIFNICQNKPPGSILVFLPGYDKISKLHTLMEKTNRYPKTRYIIFALHSMMPSVDQKKIFYPAPEDKRKIIIATNIAETSITINDVVYVIDSGKRKVTTFDSQNSIQTLNEQWVSVANSAQRRGRAGRVQPGVCYHLYSKIRLRLLDEYPKPEILCTRLENTILTIKLLGLGNTSDFLSTLIDIPDTTVIHSSINLLKRLNALDENENLTPLGLHLAQLPLDPQIGKMILLGAIFNCVDPITTVAASLSFKDPFYRPLGKQQKVDNIRCSFARNSRSDHLTIVNVFKQWRTAKLNRSEYDFCFDNFLSLSILNQLDQMKKQFCEHLSNTKFLASSNPTDPGNNLNVNNSKVLKAIIGGGLFPNIARIKNVKVVRRGGFIKVNARTEEDGNVQIHPSSVNAQQSSFDSNYLVYHMKQKTSTIFLYDTTMVTPWSLLFFGDMLKTGVENGKSYISVANLYFDCNEATINLIKDLRDGLNWLLQKKLCKPSPICWVGNEGRILTAIMHLVSIDRKLQFDDDNDDDE